MRVLWFSNCMLSQTSTSTGSWLYSMAELITRNTTIHLTNIVINSCRKDIIKSVISSNFDEYEIPNKFLACLRRRFSKKKKYIIKQIIDSISPDIVHVWGVENPFCFFVPDWFKEVPCLLEIQGLRGPCSEVFYGDLSISEIMKCIGLKELLFPFKYSLPIQKKKFAIKGMDDVLVLKKYRYISTQSDWIRSYIEYYSSAIIYETAISVRNPFMQLTWKYPLNGEKAFITISSGPIPYKSIQTAVKALSIAQKKYNDIRLYIVGDFVSNYKSSGYLFYIKRLIKKLGLEQNVIFTGSLSADKLVSLMLSCLGLIQTSYVESYSLVVAEGMSIGIPCIVSYAGAMPELAINNHSALFYSPGDYFSCSNKMIRLIENVELAESLSENSKMIARKRNNEDYVLQTQLNIYNDILAKF